MDVLSWKNINLNHAVLGKGHHTVFVITDNVFIINFNIYCLNDEIGRREVVCSGDGGFFRSGVVILLA
jgi:hypothetical protein